MNLREKEREREREQVPAAIEGEAFEGGCEQGRTQDFNLGGGDKRKKKFSNTHPYSINKLSTKTNTQKSLFLNILRYNHLLTKTKSLFQMHFPLFLYVFRGNWCGPFLM